MMYRQSKNQVEKILIEPSLISKILQTPAHIRQKMIWALLELSIYGECSYAKGVSDSTKAWFFSQISEFDWMIYQKNTENAWVIAGFVRTEDRHLFLLADPNTTLASPPKSFQQILKNTPQFSMQTVWQSKIVHLSKDEKTNSKANPQDLLKSLFRQQGISLDEQENQGSETATLFKPSVCQEALVPFEPLKHLVITAEQAKLRRALIKQRDEILLIQGARGSGLSLGLALSICESLEEKEGEHQLLYITQHKAFYQQIFEAKLTHPNRVICLSLEEYYQAYTNQSYLPPPSLSEIKKFLQKHIKSISKTTLELFQGIDRFAVFFAYFINQALPEIDLSIVQGHSASTHKAWNISLKHFNIFSAKECQSLSPQAEEQLNQQLKKLLEPLKAESNLLDHLKALLLLNQPPYSQSSSSSSSSSALVLSVSSVASQKQTILSPELRYLVMDDACQYNRVELKAFFDSLIKGLGANEKHWKLVFAGEEGNFVREQLLKWEEFKDLCALQFDRRLNIIQLEQNEKWANAFVSHYFNPLIHLYDRCLPYHLRPQCSRLNSYLQHTHKQHHHLFKQLAEHPIASSKIPNQLTELGYFFHQANYNSLEQSIALKRLVFMLLSSKQLAVLDLDGQLSAKIKLLIQNELFNIFDRLSLSFSALNIFTLAEFTESKPSVSLLFLSGDLLEAKDFNPSLDLEGLAKQTAIQQTISSLLLRLSLDQIRWILTRSNRGVILLKEQTIYLNQEKMSEVQSPLEKLLALGGLAFEESDLEDCLQLLSQNHFYQGYEFFEAFEEALHFQRQEMWLSARNTWVNLLPMAIKLFGKKGQELCETALDQLKLQALEVAINARDWRSTKELLQEQTLNHQLKILLNQQVKKQAEQLMIDLEAQSWLLFDRNLELTQDLYTLEISQDALHHICEALWKSSQKLINAKEHLLRQSKIFDRLSQLKASEGYVLLAQGYRQSFSLDQCSKIAQISLLYLDYCQKNANKTPKGSFVKGTLNHLKAWVKNLSTNYDESYDKSDALFCLFFACIVLSQKDLLHANMLKAWAEALAAYEGLSLEKTKELLSFEAELKAQPLREQILELRQRGEWQEAIKQYQKSEEAIPPELTWISDLQGSISYAKSTAHRLTEAERLLVKELAIKLIQSIEEEKDHGNHT